MFTDPASYCIRVKGQVGLEWSEWFDGITISYDETNETTLYGQGLDQTAPSGTALPDPAALQARLEETHLAFDTLLESLTDEEWDSKHTSTAWTVRELMSHMVDGLAHTPDAIDHARRGKQFLNLPSFLNCLTHPGNFWLSKWNARGQTRQAVLVRYDAAHQAMLNTIEGIRDDEWSRGAQCFGDGYKTVLDLCVLPNRHFQEHTAQVAIGK